MSVCLLIGIAALVLQTDWAKEKIRVLAEREGSSSLYQGRLSIGSLDGNLLFRLSSTDVRVYSRDSLVIAVDSVEASYNILSLLGGGLHVRDLDIRGVTVSARQRPDTTWDLLSLAPPAGPAAPSEPFTLRADRIHVDQGVAAARFHSQIPDSTIRAADIRLRLRDLYLAGEVFGVTIDEAVTRVTAPVAPDTVAISVRGELAEDHLVCSGCRLESVHSSLSINGYLLFPAERALRGDLEISVDSLAFSDIAFLAPTIDFTESVAGSISVVGTADSLSVDTDLSFSGGAAITVDALVRRGDSTSVKVSGDVVRFDPTILVRDAEFAGSLNADLGVTLAGENLASVSGPVSLRIYDTVLNGVELRDGYVDGRFDSGVGTIEGRVFVPGASLSIRGTVTPFADTLAYDVAGSFSGEGLSRRYSAMPLESAAGQFQLAGRGSNLGDAVGRVIVDLDRLAAESIRLGPTHVEATVDRGNIKADGKAEVRDAEARYAGALSFDGSLRISDDGIRADSTRFHLDNLDIQAVAPDAPPGLISGSGWLEGSVEVGAIAGGRGSMVLSGSVAQVAFNEANVAVRYASGAGTFNVDAASTIGGFDLLGDFAERERGFEFAARGRFTNLNVDTLAAMVLATDLNGTVDARLFASGGGIASLTADVTLQESAVNEQVVSDALLTIALQDSTLSFDADVELPGGSISGEGWLNPYAETLELQLREGSFANIDLGAWLDRESLATDLNGTLSATAKGSNIEARFGLDSSRINRSSVRDGSVSFSASDSTFELESTVNLDRGNMRAVLTGTLAPGDTTYQGMIRLSEADVARLIGVDSVNSVVNAGCSVVGSGLSLSDLVASTYCSGKNSRWGATRIDSLRFEASIDRDRLRLDSLSVHSNVGQIAGSGSIPVKKSVGGPRSTLELVVTLTDLSPAARLVNATRLDGDGTITLSIGGSVASPSIDAEVKLEYLTYDDYRISSLDGFLLMPDLDAGHIVAAIDAGFSVYNKVPVQRTSLAFERTDGVTIMTGDARIDARRNGRISARYEEQDGSGLVVVDALDLNLDGELWKLSENASFEISDRWSVRTFLIFSGDQQIAFDGYIDPDGEQNLIVTLDQIRLGAFTDLVGYQGVDGTGEGYIVLTGHHNDLELESNVRVQTLKTYGRDVGNFDLSATYRDAQMDVNGRLSHATGPSLTIKGFIPARITMTGLDDLNGSEPIELAVASDSVPLAWIRPFLDQTIIDRIEGYLVCDVTIGGVWDDPSLSGNATVSQGRLRLPEFKLDMRSISSSFQLEGDQLQFDDFTATSKGGRLTAAGSIGFRSLDDPSFDVDAKFNGFRAISTDTYKITTTGTGHLGGSMIRPVFTGKLSIEESDIFMTEELMADEIDPVRLTDRDLRVLERRFGYRVAAEDTTAWDFYEALDLSLEARIGRDVWLRSYANPKMDIEFSGNLTVSKAPLAEEIVSGTINVNSSRSRVISFARKFEITTGEINFNGPVDEAVVDIHAQYVVPSRFGGDEVKIKLGVTGQFADLRLELSSEPQMDTGAMVSYLTTGRPPGEGSVGGTQAAELAVSSLSNLVEGFANSELGLDVVEIQVNPTRGTYLKVGKYVSPRVYISLTQPLVTNNSYQVGDAAHQTEMAIEYELISWLVAQIGSSRNQLLVNLIWQFAF